jgi:hypothetical protein
MSLQSINKTGALCDFLKPQNSVAVTLRHVQHWDETNVNEPHRTLCSKPSVAAGLTL